MKNKLYILPVVLLGAWVAFERAKSQTVQTPVAAHQESKQDQEQGDCAASANFQQAPEKVAFPAPGGRTLYGWLYKPAGKGPFPAVIWNHGSGLMDDPARPYLRKDLAAFYAGNGYVFFTPHRTGHGLSRKSGESVVEKELKVCANADLQEMRRCRVQFHEEAAIDTVAAIKWLRQQPFVKKNKIAVSGASYGGIQTVLVAEQGLGVRAFIPFTPAAMSWANVELRKRLQAALEKGKSPVFLIQAEGDFSTGPYQLLGSYLNHKGGLNKARLYPRFGTTPQEAHAEFAMTCQGIAIWGKDVLAFLKSTMK